MVTLCLACTPHKCFYIIFITFVIQCKTPSYFQSNIPRVEPQDGYTRCEAMPTRKEQNNWKEIRLRIVAGAGGGTAVMARHMAPHTLGALTGRPAPFGNGGTRSGSGYLQSKQIRKRSNGVTGKAFEVASTQYQQSTKSTKTKSDRLSDQRPDIAGQTPRPTPCKNYQHTCSRQKQNPRGHAIN